MTEGTTTRPATQRIPTLEREIERLQAGQFRAVLRGVHHLAEQHNGTHAGRVFYQLERMLTAARNGNEWRTLGRR